MPEALCLADDFHLCMSRRIPPSLFLGNQGSISDLQAFLAVCPREEHVDGLGFETGTGRTVNAEVTRRYTRHGLHMLRVR